MQYFLSVQELVSVHLNDRGLVLIQGKNKDAEAFDSNGAGKSSMFSDAPLWCLYGMTARGHKGDEVVNRFSKKNTMVCVGIEDDNGIDNYEVRRYRKHKDFKNSVMLFHNGKNITGRSDIETDQMIVDLLQMDFQSAVNSVFFGQGISKMFASASDADQKKILELMLQIDILKVCQDKAKKLLSDMESERKTLYDKSVLYMKERNILQKTVEDLQTKEAELEQQISSIIAGLVILKDKYESELNSLESVDGLVEDKENLIQLVGRSKERLLEFSQYDKLKLELAGDENGLKREINTLKSTIASETKKLDNILKGKDVPKVCEACGQDLPIRDTSHLEAHMGKIIKEKQETLDEKVAELEETQALLSKVNKQLEGKKIIEQEIGDLQDAINDMVNDIVRIQEREKSLTRLISGVDSQIADQEKMRGTTYSTLIEKNIMDIERLESDIEKANLFLVGYDEKISVYNFWVNAFGNQGIKSILLDSVTPFLNRQANHYLTRLADNSIEIKFTTQTKLKSGEIRDKFAVEVINENGDDNYKGNSNGEKRRADLAVNMSLQDLVGSRSNKSIDFIVYDEAFEGLDAIGCERLIGILEEKAKIYGTILVITHNENLKELFKKSITVRKENKKTVLLEDAV